MMVSGVGSVSLERFSLAEGVGAWFHSKQDGKLGFHKFPLAWMLLIGVH